MLALISSARPRSGYTDRSPFRYILSMPKLLYLVTEDWFFVSHFLPMARAAREAGFEVVVATRIHKRAEQISVEGFRVIAFDQTRKSLGPLEALRNMAQTLGIIRAERPDIVHCIALRPVVLGGIAARMAGVDALVLAPTGLGHLWTASGIGARSARSAVRFVVGSWLRRPRTHYLFENSDDPGEFKLDPEGHNVTIVGGAGVAAADFPFVPEPSAPPVKLAVVARMIYPKGIADAVAATQRARALGAPVELHMFGAPDPLNRHAIAEPTLRQWTAQPGIHWHGHTANVARVWRDHHVSLFLSYYREGVPRALIEAAAAGRPIVTTDMPGCRDVVRDGQEGFIVQPHDIEAAALALAKLAGDPALRARLGAAANARFNERFTEDGVKRAVTEVYRSLVQPA
jgi:glycosyltransferase involved in cell wall biosynthesis